MLRPSAMSEQAADSFAVSHSGPTASAHPRHRRLRMAAVLITIGALAPTAGALAQPARDQHPRATAPAITFTNPLGRSRGLGAGAGLL